MSGDINYKDFDAAWEEQVAEPYVVKIRGKKYELPASVSAAFMLEITKITNQKGVNDNLNAADIGALINALFGKSVVEEWMEEGMSLPQLNDVLSHMLKVYGLDGSSSDADPKALTQQTDNSEKTK